MKILILEDAKERIKAFKQLFIEHETTFVTRADVCIEKLSLKGTGDPFEYDVLFLDHDLDGKVYVPSGPGTGYEVACYLKENPDKMPKVIILQTLNGDGAEEMLQVLPKAIHMPFVWENSKIGEQLERILA